MSMKGEVVFLPVWASAQSLPGPCQGFCLAGDTPPSGLEKDQSPCGTSAGPLPPCLAPCYYREAMPHPCPPTLVTLTGCDRNDSTRQQRPGSSPCSVHPQESHPLGLSFLICNTKGLDQTLRMSLLGLPNKMPRTGGLHNRHLFSRSAEGYTSKIKLPAGAAS